MKDVRLYGIGRHNGSFGRVTQGIKEGLESLGRLAGFVPLDELEDDMQLDGATAPLAIYAGPPSGVAAMTSYGEHQRRYAILAPNSAWLPRELLEKMRLYTEVVAPSTWGAEVVRRYTERPVPPFFHGVSKGFWLGDSATLDVTRKAFAAGEFRVLHLSSTDRQRKGTAELVDAWVNLVDRGILGSAPSLQLLVDAPKGTFPKAEAHPSILLNCRYLNARVEQMRDFYQHFHLLCQPSRAEGFGMTPLEARASGVPVCATACTGHSDHVADDVPGVVVVPVGPDAPIDDAPHTDAVAPSVCPVALADSLAQAYSCWPALSEAASTNRSAIYGKWSWQAATGSWLETIGATGANGQRKG